MMINLEEKRVPREFYARNTQLVARELLGKLLVRQWRGRQIAVRINEVESYMSEDDLASHARRGRTPRTEIMYGEAGRAYVFLIYGMYHCLNVVIDQPGFPAAVLIRGATSLTPNFALRASLGRPGEKANSTRALPAVALAKAGVSLAGNLNGPGMLTRALHITLAQNGLDIAKSGRLFIADDGFVVAPETLLATPRIGVDYAGDHALLPWRYFINFSPSDEREIKRG